MSSEISLEKWPVGGGPGEPGKWVARHGTRPLSNGSPNILKTSQSGRERGPRVGKALSPRLFVKHLKGGGLSLLLHLGQKVAWPDGSRSPVLLRWSCVNHFKMKEGGRDGQRCHFSLNGENRGSPWWKFVFVSSRQLYARPPFGHSEGCHLAICPEDPVALNFLKLCQPRVPFFPKTFHFYGWLARTIEVSRDELPANGVTLGWDRYWCSYGL